MIINMSESVSLAFEASRQMLQKIVRVKFTFNNVKIVDRGKVVAQPGKTRVIDISAGITTQGGNIYYVEMRIFLKRAKNQWLTHELYPSSVFGIGPRRLEFKWLDGDINSFIQEMN